jgi:hypothetical protein
MLIKQEEQTAIVGVTVSLSTQELIILSELVATLTASTDKIRNSETRTWTDTTTLLNATTFLTKLVGEVPNMKQVYDDLFNIKPKEEGNIDLRKSLDRL